MSSVSPAPAGNVAAPALVRVAGPGGCQTPAAAGPAPSFTPLADATYAAVPVMDRAVLPANPRLPYVCLALTGRFLLTRHSSPCPALQEIRDHYNALPGDAKADGPAVPDRRCTDQDGRRTLRVRHARGSHGTPFPSNERQDARGLEELSHMSRF
jgi:hypothetical protein